MPDVILRAPDDGDRDLLFRIAADLDTWEERNPSPPAPLSRAAWEAKQERIESTADPGDARFVIVADGVAAGAISLFRTDPLARHAEVGISLLPSARGRGIGTAALERVAEFAFVRGNLRRLHLEVIASNAAAVRAYEKAGFVREGRLREHAWVRGRYEDVLLMGRLRRERPAPGASRP